MKVTFDFKTAREELPENGKAVGVMMYMKNQWHFVIIKLDGRYWLGDIINRNIWLDDLWAEVPEDLLKLLEQRTEEEKK